MQKIMPYLWFDNNAEEAANFYASIFKNSKITAVARYGEAGPGPKDAVMTISFVLDGVEFLALNGGPQSQFSPAVAFIVNCENQKEVDEFWEKLSEGGQKMQCGWVKDKFGVMWNIVPIILGKLLQDKNANKVQSVVTAMLKMNKLEIEGLEQAYARG